MNQGSGSAVGSVRIPPIKIIYKGINLMDEIKSVNTNNSATQLTLQALGEELILEEGLENDNGNDQVNDGDELITLELESIDK